MNVHLSWVDAENTVLQIRLSATWSLHDLKVAMLTARDWISERQDEVSLCFDMRDSDMLPAQFLQISRTAEACAVANQRCVIVLSDDSRHQVGWRILRSVARRYCKTLYFASTLSEARQIGERKAHRHSQERIVKF